MAASLFSSISSSGSSASSASDRSALLVLGRAPPRSYGSLLTYQFLKSARSLRHQQVTPRARRYHRCLPQVGKNVVTLKNKNFLKKHFFAIFDLHITSLPGFNFV